MATHLRIAACNSPPLPVTLPRVAIDHILFLAAVGMRNEMGIDSAGVGMVLQLASDDVGYDSREEDHVVVARLHVQGPAHYSGLIRKSRLIMLP